MRVKTATDDQGLEIIQGDRAAFSIRKNSVMELLKNGGSAPFSPEYIEFEIEKKKKKNQLICQGCFRIQRGHLYQVRSYNRF